MRRFATASLLALSLAACSTMQADMDAAANAGGWRW